MTDQRRYGVIEVHRLNAETYHLTINFFFYFYFIPL